MKRLSFILSVFISAYLFFTISNVVRADWYVDEYGVLRYSSTAGAVLGEDEEEHEDEPEEESEEEKEDEEEDEHEEEHEDEDDNHESSSNSDSRSTGLNESEDREDEDDERDEKDEREVEYYDPETGAKTKIEIRGDEVKTEIEYEDGQSIHSKTSLNESETEIKNNHSKVKLKRENGKLNIVAEDENGNEVELGDQEIFSIRERLDTQTIKVSALNEDQMVFSHSDIAAQSSFPVSIDLATNTLIVTTSAGERRLSVLPDAAVSNLLALNIIDRIGPEAIANANISGELTGISSIVGLGERDGVPVYEILGVSDQKLLGFIPVEIERTTVVSAETGEIVDAGSPFLDRVVDAVSF